MSTSALKPFGSTKAIKSNRLFL